MPCLCLQCDDRVKCSSFGDVVPRRCFYEVGSNAELAREVEAKPMRRNPYSSNGRSRVALVRCDDRTRGIFEAVRLIGGFRRAVEGAEGYILVRPNSNSHDPFPGSTHPETLRVVLQQLIEACSSSDKIIVGDMSGPNWLPTRKTMHMNGTLAVAEEFGVKVSFFDEEDWLAVHPERASGWPNGFRISKTAAGASRIISLPCLKTHQFGGVFSLSLKNGVGLLNPADRVHLHRSPIMQELIAEINLAYSADLIVLDGMKCFISGGPAKGEEALPGVIVAGGDRVAVDAIGTCVLKFYQAKDITGLSVKNQRQLKRAKELGLGNLDLDRISLETLDLTGDRLFPDLVHSISDELQAP